MDVKPGYKQTAIGVIPEDWKLALLQDIGQWKGGATPSMKNGVFWHGGTILWASSGDIKSSRIMETELRITEAAVKKTSTTLLPVDSIILVTRSGILRRYLPIAKNMISLAINQDLKAIIPNNNVKSEYLLQALLANGSKILATCMKTGTTVESIDYSWLKAYPISFPPTIKEQCAIAAALSDMDALIAALDRLIAKKRDIKQAAMQELLTGKRRLPGFAGGNEYKQTEMGAIPDDWDTATIEEICKPNGLVRGPFGGALKKEFFVQDGFKVYEQRNAINHDAEVGNYYIDNEKFNELRRFEIKEGDFIVSCSGTIGKIFQIPIGSKQGVINQALLKIEIDDQVMLDKFFLYIFDWESFQKKVIDKQGGAMQNLVGMDIIRKISIPLPRLSEQYAIAAVLSDMDSEVSVLEARRQKTLALKQGMMQELLTGRIRLL